MALKSPTYLADLPVFAILSASMAAEMGAVIGFPCGIDIRNDDFICIGECFAECIKEELRSGIGVRLEHAPGCTVLHLFCLPPVPP